MKKSLSKLLCMLLAAAMVLALAGTVFATPSDAAAPQGETDLSQGSEPVNISDETLVWGINADPPMLEPQNPGNSGSITTRILYDRLIEFNSQTGEYDPGLAKSWETIDDRTTRYYLRDDVYASDGSNLTAEDVLYSLTVAEQDEHAGVYARKYSPSECVIHDDYTIDIVTKEPYNLAIADMSQMPLSIMSKSVTEANGGIEALIRNPINGTGPYKLVSWNPGESILLERNDNYWGDLPYFKYIDIRIITDKTAAVLALESGDVDGINGLEAALAAEVAAYDGCEVLSVPSDGCVYFGMNCQKEIFADKRVREAITCAINKDAIIAIFAAGYATKVDVLTPAHHPLYAEVDEALIPKFDVDKAKALMAEAGYADGFTVNLLVAGPYTKAAEIVQSNLKEINIDVELDIREPAAFMDASMKGEYDTIIANYFAGSPNQLYFNLDNRIATGNKNYSNFGRDEDHELLDYVYAETDFTKSKETCAQLLTIFAQEFPGVPLCSSDSLFGCRSGLTGFYTTSKGDQLCLNKIVPIP